MVYVNMLIICTQRLLEHSRSCGPWDGLGTLDWEKTAMSNPDALFAEAQAPRSALQTV